MVEKSAKICSVLLEQREVDLFNVALAEKGFRKITSFTSSKEAYEVAIRQQFEIFITRMEMTEMSGVVLIQKLRATGNYGEEIHLFVCDRLSPEILNVLYEFDIGYVLTKPFTKQTIGEKIAHLVQSENSLSDFEKKYRQARAALNNLPDMAEDIAAALLKERPKDEKILLLLGDIAAKKGAVDDMIKHYSMAKDVNPKSAIAPHKLAGALILKGRSKEAADLLDVAAKLNPYNIKLLENAGLSNFNINNFEKAESYAKQLKNIDLGNKQAGEIHVKSRIAQGDFEGMTEVLKNSHDEKEIVAFLNNAGAKLAQGNDVKGALKMYQSCLAQLQGSKYLYAVHYNIGLAYKRMGDVDKAVESFERAVKIKPDFEKAATAAAELRAKRVAK